MTPIIELKNVSLKFDEGTHAQEIFRGINLKVYAGDSVVIVGPSGHGKSLLLRLIGGLISPTAGEVLWEGRSIKALSPREKALDLRKIGMLFQRNALFDSLTAFENVAFPLSETSDLSPKEISTRVENYLYLVNLLEAKNLFPNQMSGGMQKRLGIARALALEPSLVLYDDPTAGLDPITSRHIVQLIQSLRQKTKSTTITVTNDMNRAYQVAGRIFFVLETELIETGNREQTLKFNDARIQQFISGRVEGPLTEFG